MSIPSVVRLGTRGSALALWQSRHVAAQLEAAHPGLRVELITIQTQGDAGQRADLPLVPAEGKGLFVREIEDALAAGSIDLAVHSLKDLPTEQPQGLVVTAILERADPRDALVSVDGHNVKSLPEAAIVATGSPRRRCQLLHARPDLQVVPVRGNVDTRVRRLCEGRFGALVLALAGVTRLQITNARVSPIPFEISLPAPGQGAIAVETREADATTRRFLSALDHPASARSVRAERAFLAGLGGGCLAPAAAHASIAGDRITIDAMIGDPDGRRLLRRAVDGDASQGERLGGTLARTLLDFGGDAILRDARAAQA